jgi:peptidoglycan hydrolase FlgJ
MRKARNGLPALRACTMQMTSVSSFSLAHSSEAPDPHAVRAGPAPQVKSPLVQFEAFVLQDFVAAMLPDNTENVFGKGLSGDMWKSLFADGLLKDFNINGGNRLAPDKGGGV